MPFFSLFHLKRHHGDLTKWHTPLDTTHTRCPRPLMKWPGGLSVSLLILLWSRSGCGRTSRHRPWTGFRESGSQDMGVTVTHIMNLSHGSFSILPTPLKSSRVTDMKKHPESGHFHVKSNEPRLSHISVVEKKTDVNGWIYEERYRNVDREKEASSLERTSYLKTEKLFPVSYLFACLSALLSFSFFWLWQDRGVLVLLHTKHL